MTSRQTSEGDVLSRLAKVALVVVVVASTYGGVAIGSYYLTRHQMRLVGDLRGKSEPDVDAALRWYLKDGCRPEDRVKVFAYERGRCVGYRIGGTMPVHVVFGADDRVSAVIPAYE
jgi:hypothetical protein